MEDILDDKVFTKTAFAVRIDVLEAGIREERELRARMEKELQEMRSQFLKMNIHNSALTNISQSEAENFWIAVESHMSPETLKKVGKGLTRDLEFVRALEHSLRFYGASKIGAKLESD